MKCFAARWMLLLAALLLVTPAHAANWFACGDLTQIGWSCQLANYPSTHYEYGIAYNTNEPHAVTCAYWNVGMRIFNKFPYMVLSDNPQSGAHWGGFMFYTSTLATDDDTCSGGAWRHQYWRVDPNNIVSIIGSNGCRGTDMTIWCRSR